MALLVKAVPLDTVLTLCQALEAPRVELRLVASRVSALPTTNGLLPYHNQFFQNMGLS